MKFFLSVLFLVFSFCSLAQNSDVYYCENFESGVAYPPGYEGEVTRYDTDAFLIKVDKQYGLIKNCSDTCYILPPVYDTIFYQYKYARGSNEGYFTFKNFGYYVAKKNASIILIKPDKEDVFIGKGNKLEVMDSSYCKLFRDSLQGIYSTLGTLVIPCQYTKIEPFRYFADDLGFVVPFPSIQVERGGLIGLYDFVDHREIIPPLYWMVKYSLHYNSKKYEYRRSYKDEFGCSIVNSGILLDSNAKELARYNEIEFPSEGIRIFAIHDTISDVYSEGYLDGKGAVVIPPIFKRCFQFQDGLAIVLTKEDKLGIITKTGRYVAKPEYDKIVPVFESINGVYTKRIDHFDVQKDNRYFSLENLPREP